MKRPIIKPRLLISPISNGYVVYDTALNRLHELNSTAALLLELCDGTRSVAAIGQVAAQVMPENSQQAVDEWVDEACEFGLIVEFDDVDESSDHDLSSDELIELAATLREDGFVQAAYLCQSHAVPTESDDTVQLRELAELAHIVGKRNEAREAYERLLELQPDDAEVRHLLISLRDENPPERVPDECIQQLYKRFASFYESNMCGELGYEGPTHLNEVIDKALGDRRELRVLDLGCGTGLAGLIVRERAAHLVGVDLSPEMIEQAQALRIYDELHTAELTQWLRKSNDEFDLIVACDTFIYFGDLSHVLGLAASRLAAGGSIAFSVERANAGSHQLTDNGRYVHHQSHIGDAASAANLTICSQRQAFIRMEYGKPVDGLYVCLTN